MVKKNNCCSQTAEDFLQPTVKLLLDWVKNQMKRCNFFRLRIGTYQKPTV